MSAPTDAVLTGGCQCGAVRYALDAIPDTPSICHCRMCQKAFGAPFAALAGLDAHHFHLTRGEIAVFKSSEAGRRGFCRLCGTPLTYAVAGRPRIAVSIGSLDDPERVPPLMQEGIESRLSWFEKLHRLPGRTTEASMPADLLARLASQQAPDRD
ncbi:MAG: GFA family protein [Alphaproteobacteria bacterium]|nr:GFA family protein [Alphaproteobacteria bacterium]MDX5368632.1 GFA family protein [Alphaproteobacteria bacterium]MDX5463377.1 GFA family protein [Alphaproteobacteria bacterium]